LWRENFFFLFSPTGQQGVREADDAGALSGVVLDRICGGKIYFSATNE